jgi:hypothetical protein
MLLCVFSHNSIDFHEDARVPNHAWHGLGPYFCSGVLLRHHSVWGGSLKSIPRNHTRGCTGFGRASIHTATPRSIKIGRVYLFRVASPTLHRRARWVGSIYSQITRQLEHPVYVTSVVRLVVRGRRLEISIPRHLRGST